MADTISRRKLSNHIAKRLADGKPTNATLRELAAYLIETHRQHEADLVIRDIETNLIERGTVVATVTSARPLSMAATQTLEGFIKSQYEKVSQVVIKERIDASLIGGIKLELPDKQLDASVKTRLEKLGV